MEDPVAETVFTHVQGTWLGTADEIVEAVARSVLT